MFKILLVDDEPLILGGIKSLIDWEDANCILIESARNGQRALDIMEHEAPDIVFADINMPVMDGIELLKQAKIHYPRAVFIMLTNLEDFKLARESFRYGAIDYLVKNQLESDILRIALEKAKAEVVDRRERGVSLSHQKIQKINETSLIQSAVSSLLLSPTIPEESTEVLTQSGILNLFLFVGLQYTTSKNFNSIHNNIKDLDKLLLWQTTFENEIAGSCFTNAFGEDFFTGAKGKAFLLYGNDAETLRNEVDLFYRKLTHTTTDISGLIPCLTVSKIHTGADSIKTALTEISICSEYLYNSEETFTTFHDFRKPKYQTFDIEYFILRLRKEILFKSAEGCGDVIQEIISYIKNTPHKKKQALSLCTELYFIVLETLEWDPKKDIHKGDFTSFTLAYKRIKLFLAKNEVIEFLYDLSSLLQLKFQSNENQSNKSVELAKRFVHDHLETQITLTDAAAHVHLSPGYLSSTFRKYTGEKFIDYVNRCKVEKACELLANREYRISDICDRLDFKNPYYFAKIFRRYTGNTPTDYRKGL